MIPRTLAKKLKEAAGRYPVVTVTGPRQSGKTTLVRAVFKDYAYSTLELPDQRAFAMEDPRGFLSQFEGPVILDEAQRVPDLFSYIQVMVDEQNKAGQFILTGSHNFLLLQGISQSLAGRCAVLHLLPFSHAELSGHKPFTLSELGRKTYQGTGAPGKKLAEVLFTGFYPRIHDKRLPPQDWLGNYYQTYLERDVRNVLKMGDLESFGRFVRLCAGRNAQLLNLSSLASDCGITHTTARRWISVLEASFLIVLLRPHHQNFGKRLIKSPKLYFLDTGLLCFLLQIRFPEELHHHAMKGGIFESYVLSEFYKNFLNRGELPALSFWRDTSGREVDLLVEQGGRLTPVEVKSAQTIAGDFFKGLNDWRNLSSRSNDPAALVYGGDSSFKRAGTIVYPWFAL
ncbi:MAG: ATP-binding protein [bacterium]